MLAIHTNGHPDVPTPQSVCWRLQLPTCQLGYNKTSPDGKSLDSWATSNNLVLLYDPKGAASFSSHRWNVGTNPDLAFTSFGQDNRLPHRRVVGKFPRSRHRLPHRRVVGKFPRSRHRPSLMTPPRLKVPAHSDPAKRWNFCKADWKRFCLLSGESFERLPPQESGHNKHQEGIPRILREPAIRGQTMYPTWPSQEPCAMFGVLGQGVQDPLSFLPPSPSGD